jgi:glycosyltransferase involved in cell wall biosynthesis
MVFVGTEFRRKGLHVVLEAMHRLAETTPSALHLFVIGAGEAAPYRALAERWRLTGRVHFAGYLAEVERFYAAADLLVLPTQSEPFGMAVLEAMACGLPVIVSRRAGVAELLPDSYNACVLDDPGDVVQLADAVRSLCDRRRREALGRQGLTIARAHDWDRMVDRIVQLYEQGRLRVTAHG